MSKIDINSTQNQYNTQYFSNENYTTPTTKYNYNTNLSLNDEFVSQHKKNGLIERLYNGIKNTLGLGIGSKKVKIAIDKAEKGEISEEEARNTITKYRNSQVNSAQILGDTTSILASFATFFFLRKPLKTGIAKFKLNQKFKQALPSEFNSSNKIDKILSKISKSKPLFYIATAGLAGLTGGYVKLLTGKINRIGSKEYSTDKRDFNNLQTERDKSEYKFEKKHKRRLKRKENFRNFLSGTINGLLMPITIIGGGLIGVPAYLIGNTLNRYFIGNTKEHNKSLGGYFENLKSDSLIHAGLAAGLAVPMIKKGKYTKVFDENLEKVFNKLKDANMKPSEYGERSTYKDLEDLLLNSKEIRKIMSNPDIKEGIVKLTDENIFALKFKQISNDRTEFTKILREDCPPTRCTQKADGSWDFSKVQAFVDQNIGNGEYTIEKCLGVGTVAETYLAKTKSGDSVCLKILKEGINKEKILKDKEKFAEIIRQAGKSKDETDYLLRNLDDLSDGILKEVDFTNEMNAAKELAKYTKSAKVVKPIEVKNGIYVMEKADGISLASLIELTSARNCLDIVKNNPLLQNSLNDFIPKESNIAGIIKKSKNKEDLISNLETYIKKIEDRTPQFGEINLSKEDYKYLIHEYQQVLIEQFNKVDKNGKILHADIHPGNIFIDINALRNARKANTIVDTVKAQMGKGKSHNIFTLIDTGNTIKQTSEQTQRFINLSSYIDKAAVPDITEYVLDGAILPKEMSYEKAKQVIEEALRKEFFDSETMLNKMTNESILTKTSNIMRKYGIIPADTQLNLNKARKSANNSMEELLEAMFFFSLKDIKSVDIGSLTRLIGSIGKDSLLLKKQYENMKGAQEKLNLLQMTKEQRHKQKHNPNLLKTNSEDYLTYKLKQSIKDSLF